jgi:hypothetical protein
MLPAAARHEGTEGRMALAAPLTDSGNSDKATGETNLGEACIQDEAAHENAQRHGQLSCHGRLRSG